MTIVHSLFYRCRFVRLLFYICSVPPTILFLYLPVLIRYSWYFVVPFYRFVHSDVFIPTAFVRPTTVGVHSWCSPFYWSCSFHVLFYLFHSLPVRFVLIWSTFGDLILLHLLLHSLPLFVLRYVHSHLIIGDWSIDHLIPTFIHHYTFFWHLLFIHSSFVVDLHSGYSILHSDTFIDTIPLLHLFLIVLLIPHSFLFYVICSTFYHSIDRFCSYHSVWYIPICSTFSTFYIHSFWHSYYLYHSTVVRYIVVVSDTIYWSDHFRFLHYILRLPSFDYDRCSTFPFYRPIYSCILSYRSYSTILHLFWHSYYVIRFVTLFRCHSDTFLPIPFYIRYSYHLHSTRWYHFIAVLILQFDVRYVLMH